MAQRPATPQKIFDKVAPYYDFMNSFLSFGIDRRWRRKVARSLNLQPKDQVLDVATGTASLAIAVAKCHKGVEVTGCDINKKMLEVGNKRIGKSKLQERVQLLESTGESLPFPDNNFAAVTIAFAIDDMQDREQCAREIYRVLAPGKQIALLELSMPEKGFARSLYVSYLKIFPLVQKLLRRANYSHVQKEILTYRGRKSIEELLHKVGFVDYQYQILTGGVATMHLAVKPDTTQD